MKKTFWQWLTTPIGCDSYYDYWNKKIEKGSFDDHKWTMRNYLKNSFKMKQITQEQYDELLEKFEKRIEERNLSLFKYYISQI